MNSHIYKLIPLLFFCMNDFFLTKKIKKNSDPLYQKNTSKIARNIVCLIHSLITINIIIGYTFFKLPSLISLMSTFSSGYFLFDFFYILLFDKLDLQRILYLYHHCVAFYSLNHHEMILTSFYKAFFWAEISNIPTYVVYHFLKTQPNSPMISKVKKIQKYTYLICRIPIMSYYAYVIYYETQNKQLYYISSTVYLMGIFWSIGISLM